MEAYLEVDEDNIDQLTDLGIKTRVGDELTCIVEYDILAADPDVGCMSEDTQVTAVVCDGVDLREFFDLDVLEEEANSDLDNNRMNAMEDNWYDD